MGKVIDVKDVWLRYKELTVLESVNLSIEEGDFLGIIGPNG
ncbi:ABC transporter, partial [Methanococcoides sp. SA1]|nr:ABC transporter [Methanococcoides sp. SA1]